MQLNTTFRGLNEADAARATAALGRHANRLKRLLEQPVPLRAVIESGAGGHRIVLSMLVEGEDLVAQSTDHDLVAAVAEAAERVRNQLLKKRRRREANRQRNVAEPLPAPLPSESHPRGLAPLAPLAPDTE